MGVIHSDLVVSVTSKEISAISGPGEAGAVRNDGVLSDRRNIQLDFVNHALGFQVPNLDALGGGSTEPVSVGGENKGVDDITSLERVKSLSFSEVPQHGNTIFSTGSTERSIGGDSDSVQISVVTGKIVAEFAVAKVPDLDESVPTSRNNDWGRWGWRESHAGNPLGVSILNNGKFAFTKGVPELDSAIARTGNDLTVISAEGNREDILGVSDESASANTRVDVPKAEGVVPGSSQSKLTIRGDDNIRHKVVVSTKGSASISIVITIFLGQSPDNNRFISGRRKNHVRILWGGGDGGNPSTMSG